MYCPDIVGFEQFLEVVILLLSRYLSKLCMNSIVVGGSLDITDDTQCYGEAITVTHQGQFQLQCVVLTVGIVYEYVIQRVAIPVFRLLLHGLRSREIMLIRFQSGSGRRMAMQYLPLALEYSRKNGESAPKRKAKPRKKERESVLGLGKELPDAQYARRKKRARRVSYFTAMFAMGVVAIGLALFLWTFMLRDMFSPAERIELPNFVGQNYEDVINSADNKEYNFTVVLKSDQSVEDGIILAQSPEAKKSVMRLSSGIDVTLTVSAGVIMTDMDFSALFPSMML